MTSTGLPIFTASCSASSPKCPDAAGTFLVRAVHDKTRGWQWVAELL